MVEKEDGHESGGGGGNGVPPSWNKGEEKRFSKKTKKCVESMKAERLANLMNGRVM